MRAETRRECIRIIATERRVSFRVAAHILDTMGMMPRARLRVRAEKQIKRRADGEKNAP